MHTYVAFLRGINVGERKVLMQDLQQVFKELHFENVKTLIASRNVLFDSAEKDEVELRESIENALEKRFGFTISVILRTKEELQKLVERKPFVRIASSPSASRRIPRNDEGQVSLDGEKGVRLQVTLFNNPVSGEFPIQKNGFEIFLLGQKELGSVVYPDGKTTELMTYIDKTFGKDSTTRNWHTLEKLTKK